MVPVTSNHLWSCIAGTTAGCFQRLALFIHITEAEIDDFELSIKVNEQVFGFQISVANTELVDVMNTSQKLLEVFASRSLLQFLILDYEFK